MLKLARTGMHCQSQLFSEVCRFWNTITYIYMLFSVIVHMIFFIWHLNIPVLIRNSVFYTWHLYEQFSGTQRLSWPLRETLRDNHCHTAVLHLPGTYSLGSTIMETATISGDWILRILHNVQCFTVNNK